MSQVSGEIASIRLDMVLIILLGTLLTMLEIVLGSLGLIGIA